MESKLLAFFQIFITTEIRFLRECNETINAVRNGKQLTFRMIFYARQDENSRIYARNFQYNGFYYDKN